MRLFANSDWKKLFPDTIVVLDEFEPDCSLPSVGVSEGCGVLSVNGNVFSDMEQFAAMTREDHELVLDVCGVGLEGGLSGAPVEEEFVEAERQDVLDRVHHEVGFVATLDAFSEQFSVPGQNLTFVLLGGTATANFESVVEGKPPDSAEHMRLPSEDYSA